MFNLEGKDKELSELLYLSLFVFSKWNFSMIPELALLIDPESLLNLSEIYGGRTLVVPTKDNLLAAARTLAYYYCTEVLKEEEALVCKRYKINNFCLRHIKGRIKSFEKFKEKGVIQFPNKFFQDLDKERIQSVFNLLEKGA